MTHIAVANHTLPGNGQQIDRRIFPGLFDVSERHCSIPFGRHALHRPPHRIFGYAEDTPARQNANELAFAPAYCYLCDNLPKPKYMKKKKAVFNWSGGKDSAHALWRAMQSGEYEIVALLTTVEESTQRSTMHDIPSALLQAQAGRIGIPLHRVDLASGCGMEGYGAAMTQSIAHFKALGVTHFIFGDIFLHDVRTYRQRQLAPHGIEVVEPLWGKSSEEVMEDFLASGLQTMVVTTMDDGLGRDAIGRTVDRAFVASLPAGADPNGENGEYHTFCYDGPLFSSRIPFRLGEPRSRSYDIRLDDGTTKRYTYWFADLAEE